MTKSKRCHFLARFFQGITKTIANLYDLATDEKTYETEGQVATALVLLKTINSEIYKMSKDEIRYGNILKSK